GVLLNAGLSGAGAAAGMRDRERSSVAAMGDSIRWCGHGASGGGVFRAVVDDARDARAWRHFRRADTESGVVHAFAGAHDRPDVARVRVSAVAVVRGGHRVS